MAETAITYDLTTHAQRGTTRQLAEQVRSELARGHNVYVATAGAMHVRGDVWLADYDALTPIGPGDYVRYQCPNPGSDSWAEGEVVGQAKDCKHDGWLSVSIAAGNSYLGKRMGAEWSFGPTALRRIPRPEKIVRAGGETFAVGDRIRWRPCAESSWGGLVVDGTVERIGAAGSVTAMRITAVICETPPVPRAPHLGELIGVSHKPGTVTRRGEASDDIGQALVDGLTPVQCYARWLDNRACVESGRPLHHPTLTPAQIQAGHAAFIADRDPRHANALRALIAAGRDADRNRVQVDLEIEPWE